MLPEGKAIVRSLANHGIIQSATYFVFLASKSFQVAPGSFIHGIRVAQVGSCLKIMPGCCCVFLDAPAVAKAVPELENRKDELSFGSAAFVEPCLESLGFDQC